MTQDRIVERETIVTTPRDGDEEASGAVAGGDARGTALIAPPRPD